MERGCQQFLAQGPEYLLALAGPEFFPGGRGNRLFGVDPHVFRVEQCKDLLVQSFIINKVGMAENGDF